MRCGTWVLGYKNRATRRVVCAQVEEFWAVKPLGLLRYAGLRANSMEFQRKTKQFSLLTMSVTKYFTKEVIFCLLTDSWPSGFLIIYHEVSCLIPGTVVEISPLPRSGDFSKIYDWAPSSIFIFIRYVSFSPSWRAVRSYRSHLEGSEPIFGDDWSHSLHLRSPSWGSLGFILAVR